MKVIFLDFDGVLNSKNYFRKSGIGAPFIDTSRMVLLAELTNKTNARIVLTTSWREHWDRKPEKCDAIGKQINEIFGSFSLKIFDKTPRLKNERDREILQWLSENGDVQNYVILDDMPFGWGELTPHFVRTLDYKDGLDESSLNKALKILNGNINDLEE